MSDAPQRYVPPPRESWRLTFAFDGAAIELLRSESLPMVSPATIGEPPQGDRQAGAWLEVLDDEGRVIFHRLLHDPLAVRAEHHSPDGRIEVHFRPPQPGRFEAVVPALATARSVRLWLSPPSEGSTQEPAQDQGRFALDDPGEADRGSY